jgi:DNA invertase Pin-like site-specific DNA recombinase
MTTAQSRIRCAIYTRKSSEEGLEQSFNSLQAQREACEAFIASQRHEGWHALHKHYDDGGFSGGNTDRPALQQLLADVAAGRLDTIVVYKVDRLTRSLADFAKIIEVFDQKSVSFVSVTQQFNTTTSMGRLTLNVLLSFAQFEREVTGERIRDKIAASKRKGMWMGGQPPLGYDCKQGQLRVNPEEAAVVREIFTQYLRLGCVSQLKRHLDAKQIRSKQRTSAGGRTSGGVLFSRGALYHLLNNQIYLGKIVHHRQAYAGQHEAIVPIDLWQKVTAHLAANNRSHRRPGKRSSTSLLTGLLFDPDGNRYTPTHAVRKGKRYRYYTCQAVIQKQRKPAPTDRLPAAEIEELICSRLRSLLTSPQELVMIFAPYDFAINKQQHLIQAARKLAETPQDNSTEPMLELVRQALTRVIVTESSINLELATHGLIAAVERAVPRHGSAPTLEPLPLVKTAPVFLTQAYTPARRGSELRLVLPPSQAGVSRPNLSLLKAIVRAQEWRRRIVAGEIHSKEQIARESRLHPRYVGRILRLAVLAPRIVQAIVDREPVAEFPLSHFHGRIPLSWQQQQAGLMRL